MKKQNFNLSSLFSLTSGATALIFVVFYLLLSFSTGLCWCPGKDLVRIDIPSQAFMERLMRISVDVVTASKPSEKPRWVKAYLSEEEQKYLVREGFSVEILYDEMAQEMADWVAAITYPGPGQYYTYQTAYDHLVYLNNTYPNITRLMSIGVSWELRQLWTLKITDNPDIEENEPEIRLVGAHHGDEWSSFEVPMDVADWILANYDPGNPNNQATKLVNGTEIWVTPMVNPDGVNYSTRYNRNPSGGVDLNRNYWGPIGWEDGDYPYSEPETTGVRDLTEVSGERFVTSISFHAGAVCFNSVYNYTPAPTPDEYLFFSSRTGGPNGGALPMVNGIAHAYQLACTAPGFWYTNGYEWYQTLGDTNDWSYALWSDIDTTVEVTTSKIPPASQITTYCGQHRQAVINYMLKTFQGIAGTVTDAANGAPLDATVTVAEVPQKVYTDPIVGDYHRVLLPNTYTATAECPGYLPKTVNSIVVTVDNTTIVNFALTGAPVALEYHNHDIDDSAGDSDGIPEAGESIILPITLYNAGGAEATGISGQLQDNSTYINITDANANFADIPGTGTGSSLAPHFAFAISPSCPTGELVTFTLNLTANGGYSDSVTFQIKIGKSPILFVDDDEGLSTSSRFTDALDELGEEYDTYVVPANQPGPDLATLQQYEIVLWTTGDDPSSTLLTGDITNLEDYLDSGGRLFLSGQDILYDIASSTTFDENYLHVISYNNDANDATVMNGQTGNYVSDGLNLTIVHPFANHCDVLQADFATHPTFVSSDGTGAVNYHETASAGYRVVFFAFPFEAVWNGPDLNNRTYLMSRILAFLRDPVVPVEIFSFTAQVK